MLCIVTYSASSIVSCHVHVTDDVQCLAIVFAVALADDVKGVQFGSRSHVA